MDNATNMKAAWRILSEKYNHISCYGCAAHTLNLLTKDFVQKVPWIRSTVESANQICKIIKRKQAVLAVL